MIYALLLAIMIVFAIQALRAKRLIVAALWLAGCSALVSIAIYLLGAYLLAVIELSVGAGLVTVLFAFAITVAGEETLGLRSFVPKALAAILTLIAIGILGCFAIPTSTMPTASAEANVSSVLWQERSLDVFVQVVLIFAGVLGLLGLMAEAQAPLKYPAAEEVSARREQELQALQQQSLEKESI